jgi:hypothetical protein
MTSTAAPHRPRTIAIIGWLFTLFGAVALAGGSAWIARELAAGRGAALEAQLYRELLPMAITWILALVGGVLLLRGENRARWVLVAWAGFHVVISLFHSTAELATHGVVLVVLLFFLYRPTASAFFGHVRPAAE